MQCSPAFNQRTENHYSEGIDLVLGKENKMTIVTIKYDCDFSHVAYGATDDLAKLAILHPDNGGIQEYNYRQFCLQFNK